MFLDEPTLGLDPAGQEQVLRVVRGISGERAATVVLSTHLLAEVEEVCSRVLILNRGRLVADGTVAEVARRAAAPRRGRFRVPAEARDGAVLALATIPALGAVRPDDGRAGWLVVDAPDVDVRGAAAALDAAGIPRARLRARGRAAERRLPGDDRGRLMAVVAGRELRDLWIGGRGLVLAFAFSLLLSAITYLGATNEALNFLERREAVNLTLQVAVGRRRPAGPARRGRRDQRRA